MGEARRPRRRVTGMLAAAAVAWSPALHAQPVPVSSPPAGVETEDAAAFRHGLTLYEAKDYHGAIGVWERLLQTLGEARGWKMLYNLGLAHQTVGDATHAVERFEAFLRQVAARPDAASDALSARRRDAEERVRSIKTTYGAVNVRTPSSDEAPLVRFDSDEARAAGYTAYLLPAVHDVEIGVGSPRARHTRIAVVAGETTDLEATLGPAQQPAPPATLPSTATTPTRASPPPRSFPTGWLVAGAAVTLASFALPLGLGLRAESKHDDALSVGAGSSAYSSAADEYRSARTAYYVSYALPAVAAIATTAIVLFEWGRGHAEVGISPPGTTGGVALWARGRF